MAYLNLKETVEEAVNKLNSIKNFLNIHYYSDLIYLLTKLKHLYNNSPLKIGDIIRLKEAPEITNEINNGWLPYKDILIKDAIGKIVGIDYCESGFLYGIEFSEYEGHFRFRLEEIEKDEN